MIHGTETEYNHCILNSLEPKAPPGTLNPRNRLEEEKTKSATRWPRHTNEKKFFKKR